jgi:hypothetical protein
VSTMNPPDDVLAVLKGAKEKDELLGALLKLCTVVETERKSFISQVVSLHNAGEINLFGEFQKLRNDQQGSNFFSTRHIFEETLPNLQGASLEAAKCTVHLIIEAGQDLVAGTPINAFRLFLDASPTRPAEVLAHIEQDPGALSMVLPATIAAGFARNRVSFTKEVVRLSQAPLIDLRRPAVFSLGSIELLEHEEVPEEIVCALESAASEVDDGVLAATVTAATTILREHRKAAARLEKVIRDALEKGGEWTLDAASNALVSRSEKLGQPLIEILAGHLKKVSLANARTIHQIDLGISVLLNSASRDVVLSLLETILRRSPSDKRLKKFASAKAAILASPALLSKTLTRWIASGETALCNAAADLVQQASHRGLIVEADADELPGKDDDCLTFTARKAVGHLFYWPVTAASFVISLMRLGAIKSLKQLILDPLLLNHPASVQEFLQTRSKSEPAAVSAAIDECLKAIDDYFTKISTSLNLRELRPSETQRAAFHQSFSQKMSSSFEAAQAEMPLLSLIKRSVVLHGRGSVHRIVHQDGSLHRADLMFKTLGAEMEFPRMGRIDEIGMQLQLRSFRAARKAK